MKILLNDLGGFLCVQDTLGVSDGNEYTSHSGDVPIAREPIERKHRTSMCDD